MGNRNCRKKVEKGKGNDNGCCPYSYLQYLSLHFPNYPFLSLSFSNYNYSLSCSCSTHSLHQHNKDNYNNRLSFSFFFSVLRTQCANEHNARKSQLNWIELKDWIDLFRIQLDDTTHYSQLWCVWWFVCFLWWWKQVRIVAWRWRSTCDRSSARRRFRDARIAWALFQGSLRCIYSTQCVTNHCVIISNSFNLFACIVCFPFPFQELVNLASGDLDPRLLCRIHLERVCHFGIALWSDYILAWLGCLFCFFLFRASQAHFFSNRLGFEKSESILFKHSKAPIVTPLLSVAIEPWFVTLWESCSFC